MKAIKIVRFPNNLRGQLTSFQGITKSGLPRYGGVETGKKYTSITEAQKDIERYKLVNVEIALTNK